MYAPRCMDLTGELLKIIVLKTIVEILKNTYSEDRSALTLTRKTIRAT